MFKAFILIAAIVVAAGSASNLEPFFQSFKATLFDNLGLEGGRSDPLTQATADVGELSQADKLPSILTETAVLKSVDPSPTESQSDVLFRQFQAWAAAQKDKDSLPAQTVQDMSAKVAQNAPTPSAEKARAPIALVKNHRIVVHNARSETPIRSPRKPPQPVQSAQAQVPASLQAEAQRRSQ
jgi:hypothetical protein